MFRACQAGGGAFWHSTFQEATRGWLSRLSNHCYIRPDPFRTCLGRSCSCSSSRYCSRSSSSSSSCCCCCCCCSCNLLMDLNLPPPLFLSWSSIASLCLPISCLPFCVCLAPKILCPIGTTFALNGTTFLATCRHKHSLTLYDMDWYGTSGEQLVSPVDSYSYETL